MTSLNTSSSRKQQWRLGLIVFLILMLNTSLLFGQDLSMAEKIFERITGPFHLRFIFQPLIAIILGIRDGVEDAKQNTPPYLMELITGKGRRKSVFLKGINALATPLIIGIFLDLIIQFILFDSINFKGALLLGAVIIGLPYALARGISNRIKQQN